MFFHLSICMCIYKYIFTYIHTFYLSIPYRHIHKIVSTIQRSYSLRSNIICFLFWFCFSFFSVCFSNGGSSTGRVTLQDIVRSDPGYTPNIEHLVFPERKSSNPNLTGNNDGSPPPVTTKSKSNASTSGRSRLVEVFARHYSRGSLQDSTVTLRKNHLNVSFISLIFSNVTLTRLPRSPFVVIY